MAAPFDDDRLTMVGLLFEATAGLGRELERHLERDAGLSVQWFEVLLRLARTPGHRLRMSDLAAQTTLTPSGLTRAVDRLEAAGFVEREVCPSDRRGSFAVLTAAGRRRVAAAVGPHLERIETLVGGALDDDERRTLSTLARKLRDATNPAAARAVGVRGALTDRTDFEAAVAAVLDRLAPGDVVTYGEVAAEAGYPGAARAVGAYLARSGGAHAWWRVVTSSGRLVPGYEAEHARRLAAEGVRVEGGRVRRA